MFVFRMIYNSLKNNNKLHKKERGRETVLFYYYYLFDVYSQDIIIQNGGNFDEILNFELYNIQALNEIIRN